MNNVLIKTGCIIALALAALMMAADSNAETYDTRNPICMPEGSYLSDIENAYNTGSQVGERMGYAQGGIDAAKYILELFADKCTESGTEIELSNDVVVVCK